MLFGTSKCYKNANKIAKEAHDRTDNATVTFTDICRDNYYDTLEALGYEIDRETDPKNRSKRNKDAQTYKQEKLAEENEMAQIHLGQVKERIRKDQEQRRTKRREPLERAGLFFFSLKRNNRTLDGVKRTTFIR